MSVEDPTLRDRMIEAAGKAWSDWSLHCSARGPIKEHLVDAILPLIQDEPHECHSGHRRSPLILWNCPECVQQIVDERDAHKQRVAELEASNGAAERKGWEAHKTAMEAVIGELGPMESPRLIVEMALNFAEARRD